MVRAGAVNHPFKWMHGGYREIQKPPKRYAIIDLRELTSLCGFADSRDFQIAHHQWVEKTFNGRHTVRDDRWSESIAVGNLAFVESVKSELGTKRCIAQLNTEMERMHYENRATLTTVISAPKVSR